MPARLSKKTELHIAALFPPESRAEVSELLLTCCGNNLPFCESEDEFQLERIRFAVLKVSGGDLQRLKKAIELAQRDWRDALMAAGFGHDVKAHTRWSP
jgi:hypothetical protein